MSVASGESFGAEQGTQGCALGEDDRAGHAGKSRRQSTHRVESAAHGSLVRTAVSQLTDQRDAESLSRIGVGDGGVHGFYGSLRCGEGSI